MECNLVDLVMATQVRMPSKCQDRRHLVARTEAKVSINSLRDNSAHVGSPFHIALCFHVRYIFMLLGNGFR